MGLFSFIAKQFIDVIEWTENQNGVLAYRYPMQDNEIQYGAKLTVRESQMAVFVNEGQLADVMPPGLHTLTTQTIPVLTYLKNWDKLFESPFKSDVYFFSTRLQLDCKWGTPNPITVRDKEYGPLRIRAFGIYSYRIVDPKVFHTQVSGTRDIYTVEDLDGQLRNTIVGSLTDLFASSGLPFVDMAANQDELGGYMTEKLKPVFARYGLELDNFVVQNISLPEELQKVLDQRTSMNLVGDINALARYNAAQAIPIAAANEGGLAGAGAGMGAGVAIGQAMAQAFAQPAPAAAAPAVAPAAPAAAAPAAAEDPFALLERLHGLVAKGILTQQEFDAKKAEILQRMA